MTKRAKGITTFCLLPLLFFSAGQAIAVMQGEGRVNMQGAIIDTACAIATESREQVIHMETLPLSELAREGQGKSMPFSIELVNCILERPNTALPNWKQFQITFDGQADGELFGVNGEASGVALRIVDSAGHIARPGIPLPTRDIVPGNYRLDYALALISNQQPLKAGRYFSSVRFKMDYY